ncbi:MAG: hypothetical protein ABSD29_25665 [Verrucomicrobiota bacterium]|jgi:hypothetical protein
MKQILILATATVVALFFNAEWEWHTSSTSTVSSPGPPGGIALCAVICAVLVYRSFLALQDILIARGHLGSRVTTAFDLLPLIILLPMAVGYVARGEGWFFKWSTGEITWWYYLAVLGSVFVLKIYTVLRRVADKALYDSEQAAAPNAAPPHP